MVEREIKERKLELLLVVASKWDIFKIDYAGAEKRNAKKVGEMDVYEYMKEEVEGEVFYKKVYDNEERLKEAYFSNSRELVYGNESLRLMSLVGVPNGEYVYIDNKREIENG